MKTFLLNIVLLTAFAVRAVAQVSDKDIVDNAFPSALNDGDGLRYARFITADLNRNNQPLIVAVYTNGARGVVRVLNRAGQILSEPDLRGMRGFHATVKAVDLDADGTPEIVVEMTPSHGLDKPDTWIFRWANNALALMSPTCPAHNLLLTCFARVTFVDVTGNGKLSVLAWPSFHNDEITGKVVSRGGWTLYENNNGTLQKLPSTFAFAREFRRGSGAPVIAERHFAATAGTGRLRIINGTGKGAADSGHVSLNGAEIVGPSDIKRMKQVLEVPVSVLTNNVVTVKLDGKPASHLYVFVEATPVVP